jgi:hypothetical protein
MTEGALKYQKVKNIAAIIFAALCIINHFVIYDGPEFVLFLLFQFFIGVSDIIFAIYQCLKRFSKKHVRENLIAYFAIVLLDFFGLYVMNGKIETDNKIFLIFLFVIPWFLSFYLWYICYKNLDIKNKELLQTPSSSII